MATLKQPCPDLLPGDQVGRILLVPRNPVVEFRALRFGKPDNPILLNLENYSVKEAPNSRATPVTVDHRETQVFL